MTGDISERNSWMDQPDWRPSRYHFSPIDRSAEMGRGTRQS